MADQTARSAVARRLFAAMLVVLGLFAAALAVELITLGRIGEAEDAVARLDHAKHAGHMAAAQVREQYIHQAHTLIEFDTGHLGHYEEAVAATRRATDHLLGLAETDEERRLAREIARLARTDDEDFRARVIPAVAAGDRSVVATVGPSLEAVVDEVVRLNEQLNARFEARSEQARARAEVLRAQARWLTLGIFALAILLAGVVGLWLTRSILRPVAALQAGVRRVGSGDLSARIAVTHNDEFGELATAFNTMAADLARHQEERVRSQKLASVGQVAAGVAHEINNPLGVILGYVKLLRRQPPGQDAEELRIIEDEAVQCQRIVQGLLDLARPQRLDVSDVDLAEVARDAVARLDETAPVPARTITPPPPGVVALVRGDERKLRQVVTNVIMNAAQATATGGRVTIAAESAGDEVALAVADDGPGIAPEALPHIFDPFFTTKRDGTGLGLAIAQAIVDAHGGRIEVRSLPGAGTRVTLRIPARPAKESSS